MVHFLPRLFNVTYECEHCGEFISGKFYRVTSIESGVKLLDMIVCYSCFIESQKLGLQAEELDSIGESQSTISSFRQRRHGSLNRSTRPTHGTR